MRQFLASLRGRLILIVAVAVFGLCMNIFFQITAYRSDHVQETEQRALELATIVAAQNRMHFDGVEATLRGLAQDPVVRYGEPPICTARFAQLDRELQAFGYTRIGLLNIAGSVHCAGIELDEPVDRSDRRYYLNAMERRSFSLGAYQLGPISGETIVVAAYPILDQAGAVQAILAAGISTAWLGDLLHDIPLQDGAAVRVIDEEGTVVAEHPAGPGAVGQALADARLFDTIRRQRRGTAITGAGSAPRIVGFAPVDEGIGRLFVAAYLPQPSMLEWLAEDVNGVHLSIIGVVVIVVAAFGLSIYYTILGGIRRLSAVSQRLANGDLTARSGLPRSAGEFGTLASHIDHMAVALENRDRKIQHSTRKLENANKDLEHFAYIASHDLRAPLRGIDNLVQWIEEDLDQILNEESRYNMQRLRQRVDRLDQLMGGLLQYSRAGRSREEQSVVNTRDLVVEAVGLLDPPDGMVVEIADDMPMLSTNKAALQTVFANLIGNAVKHHDRDHGRITVSARWRNGAAEFSITDDGPGIPVRARNRIFDMFQTLDAGSQKPGSGIGLAIVKRLVERHDGIVEAMAASETSERGTTFRFTWTTPRAERGAEPADRGHEAR